MRACVRACVCVCVGACVCVRACVESLYSLTVKLTYFRHMERLILFSTLAQKTFQQIYWDR